MNVTVEERRKGFLTGQNQSLSHAALSDALNLFLSEQRIQRPLLKNLPE